MFELEDGMVFNPETGLRDFEAEKVLVPNKDYSNDLAGSVNKAIDDANLSQPTRTDAPEIETQVLYKLRLQKPLLSLLRL